MRTSAKEPERLLSLNELSRELNITWPRALELARVGVLSPDFVASQSHLFRLSRIPELRRAVGDGTGLARAIKARQAQLDQRGP